ncbi:hypothetical protein [Luteolibacter sp. LG18]|uniref:hypothetical protein n=1 Tax=Luteolibacter sp. LG18 TaxID=2819286 RepID=UPI002B2D621F|nr:hypothetical protein llg_25000 [Luteolibacter sp. LG18]
MSNPCPSPIPEHWNLPASIRNRLGVEPGRQRVMDEDNHLLLILHAPPTPDDDELRRAILFWQDHEDEWESHPEEGGREALRNHLQRYADLAHRLDEQVEAAKTPRDFFEVMKQTNPLLRAARNQLIVLEEARSARPDSRFLIVMRDQAVAIDRAIELVAADAKSGMDFTMAENAEQQAQFAYEAGIEARRLNRLVAFFFPIATLVAVFGINKPEDILHMPSFWIVLAVGVLAGFLVLFVLSLRMKSKE